MVSRRDFLKLSAGALAGIIPPDIGFYPGYMLEWQNSVTHPKQAADKLAERWEGKYFESDSKLYNTLNYVASPYESLFVGGDCEDAVLAMAYGLENNDYLPFLLLISTEDFADPHNHAVFPFKKNLWGYVSLTNYDKEWKRIGTHTEYVEPRFTSLESMLSYYRDEHPLSNPYEYYLLVDMRKIPYWQISKDIKLGFEHVIETNLPA